MAGPAARHLLFSGKNVAGRLLIVVVLLTAGCWPASFPKLVTVDVSNYKGDGQISILGSNPINQGFKIEFDRMDLRSKFSKTYELVDFPHMEQLYEFGLYVKSERNDLEDDLKGVMSFTVSAPEGKTICRGAAPLAEWTYSNWWYEGYNHYFVYLHEESNSSCAEPESVSGTDGLSLIVEYDPRGTTLDTSGVIQLKVGGFY